MSLYPNYRVANTAAAQAFSAIPEELTARPQWVVWKLELREGKPTKVPHNPRTGKKASSTDPDTWGTLAQASEALKTGRYSGLGYVFSEDDPFFGVDVDHCRDPKTGAFSEHALELMAAFEGGYVETSPSGTGIHIVGRGYAPGRKNQRAGIEAYSKARFFTITGERIAGAQRLPDKQDALDALAEKYFAETSCQHDNLPPTPTEPVDLDDAQLLERARNARKGMGVQFKALHDRGDISDFPSHSEAREALLKQYAFWTRRDPERMSRLYEQSALYAMPGYARKWERLKNREINRAIERTPRAFGGVASPTQEDGGHLAKVVAALRVQAGRMAWEGRSGPTDRAVYDALLELAAIYGSIAKKGVIIAADIRSLALAAGTNRRTVIRALHRLREERKLIRLSKKSTGYKAAVYLLKYPPVSVTIRPCVSYGDTYRNGENNAYAPALREVRNSGPTTDKEYDKKGRKLSQGSRHLLGRLGKYPTLIIEKVALAGVRGLTLSEIAQATARRTDNLKPHVQNLVKTSLLIEEGDRYIAPDDLEWRLQRELEESGCVEAKRLDAKRYAKEREAFRNRRQGPQSEGPSAQDMDSARTERAYRVLEAFQRPGSGPARIVGAYIDGETKTFEYVVRAVAHYFGAAGEDAWLLWRPAVEDAYVLFAGTPVPADNHEEADDA